jgi:hypothetical protein
LEASIIAQKFHISVTEFKASYRWVRWFLNCRQLSIRRTTISQKLPEEYEEKLIDFQKFVISLRKKHGCLLSQIGNTDQIPVWFHMPELTTIEHVGERSVQVRTAVKQRCTVMLAITADGQKLPPFVIFRKELFQKTNLQELL